MASTLAFRARLKLFSPSDGGWTQPFPQQQLCLCDVGSTFRGRPVFLDARITLEQSAELAPGEEATVLVEPLHPELWDHVQDAQEFTVHQGFTAKGRGVVLERFLQGTLQ